jgi:hypothetical protein
MASEICEIECNCACPEQQDCPAACVAKFGQIDPTYFTAYPLREYIYPTFHDRCVVASPSPICGALCLAFDYEKCMAECDDAFANVVGRLICN